MRDPVRRSSRRCRLPKSSGHREWDGHRHDAGYFNAAWGFPSGAYAGPYHGISLAELPPVETQLPRRWPEHGLWDE
jgi:hypothetical protein